MASVLKKPLAIDLIRTDANTQSREGIREETVTEYAKVLEEGDWLFPDLIVFYDGSEYYLADGFQRRLAALRVGRASVPCVIYEGTAIDARVYANSANLKHGDRCTQADKRRNAEWAVVTFPDATQSELALKAGCSAWLIKEVRAARNEDSLRGNTPPDWEYKGCATLVFQEEGDDLTNGTPNDDATPSDDVSPKRKKRANSAKTKTGRKYERPHYFKLWEKSVGPLVRLVDKISEGVSETNGKSHKAVLEHLNKATEEMARWMKR